MANPATRTVTIVAEHGKLSKGDSPKCWAYTINTLVSMSGRSRSTILRHIDLEKLNPCSLESVMAYIAASRARKAAKQTA